MKELGIGDNDNSKNLINIKKENCLFGLYGIR